MDACADAGLAPAELELAKSRDSNRLDQLLKIVRAGTALAFYRSGCLFIPGWAGFAAPKPKFWE